MLDDELLEHAAKQGLQVSGRGKIEGARPGLRAVRRDDDGRALEIEAHRLGHDGEIADAQVVGEMEDVEVVARLQIPVDAKRPSHISRCARKGLKHLLRWRRIRQRNELDRVPAAKLGSPVRGVSLLVVVARVEDADVMAGIAQRFGKTEEGGAHAAVPDRAHDVGRRHANLHSAPNSPANTRCASELVRTTMPESPKAATMPHCMRRVQPRAHAVDRPRLKLPSAARRGCRVRRPGPAGPARRVRT